MGPPLSGLRSWASTLREKDFVTLSLFSPEVVDCFSEFHLLHKQCRIAEGLIVVLQNEKKSWGKSINNAMLGQNLTLFWNY